MSIYALLSNFKDGIGILTFKNAYDASMKKSYHVLMLFHSGWNVLVLPFTISSALVELEILTQEKDVSHLEEYISQI